MSDQDDPPHFTREMAARGRHVVPNVGRAAGMVALALMEIVVEQKREIAHLKGQCEPMDPDEEGWSEWIHPLPGYLMRCCDCGLVHKMEFAIGKRDGDGPLNEGESDETGVILFRAARYDIEKEPSDMEPSAR